GKSFGDFLHPDWKDHFKENFPRFKAIGEILGVEFEIVKKDGSLILVSFHGKIGKDKQGHFQQTHCIFQDITKRKQMEEALRDSEERFNLAMDATQDGLYDWNLNTNEIYYSPSWKRLLGYNDDELPNDFSIWETLTDPEDVKRSWNMQQDLINKKRDRFELEFKMKHKDGHWVDILSRAKAIFDSDGNAIRIVGTHVDISERKREEARYKQTIESAIDGFWIIGFKGEFLEVNEAYSSMIGYSRDELLTMSIMDVESVEDPEETKKRIEKIIRTGSDRFESKHRHKKGHIIDVEVSTTYTQDSSGMFFVFLRDITDRNKMDAQLRQAQKMESIGTLAGGIAHDFNNILYPILGHTEMLLDDVPEGSPFKESLNEIYTGALRAKDLVKQILAFSRQESSELKLMKMQPIVKEALKLIRSTIPTTIEIKQDIHPDCGVIKADPTQIHQIVMNLATNAYHAMEETGGELRVSLKEMEFGTLDLINPNMAPGGYACLIVSDTGVGMDKKLTAKIFDPFFSTKAVGKGTGMGLSVVHGIVTVMGGTIQVYSEPEKGTQFHVYFPIEKSSFEEQVTHSTAKIQSGTEQILLVDDEEAILKMEKRMLERLGYQVTSRTSSLEALEAFRVNPDKFDLVITDMSMPNMPGDKLAGELTKIRPDIPVLLCTGFSETISEEKALSLGIKGFLLKPIVMKDLSHKIREVLGEN
ncbi:MAG: PAS domain S-box protein, partial [Desulfobacula sp.]|nr:PAS domain S-box protein [Desulfobacula sp.]